MTVNYQSRVVKQLVFLEIKKNALQQAYETTTNSGKKNSLKTLIDACTSALDAAQGTGIVMHEASDDGFVLGYAVDIAKAMILVGENYQKLLDAKGVEEAYKSITLKWTEVELGLIEPGMGAFNYKEDMSSTW